MTKIILLAILLCFSISLPKSSYAQFPIAEVIKAGVKKAIRALDLKVQRLQNQTIWLQNAQKTLENALSKLKLQEISEWTEKQRKLYQDYFEELNKVKSIISYYHRIKDISQKQLRLVKSYQRAWNLLKQDDHFTSDELDYMSKVYSGILDESLKNIDQVLLVINSFQTQMSDAKRLEIIRNAAETIDNNYYDLLQFNQQNILLSISRAKSKQNVAILREIYGLPKNP